MLLRRVWSLSAPLARAQRLHASGSSQYQRPSILSLFRSPTTKSLILTIAFGSIATELSQKRSELEAFQTSQTIKDDILAQVISKLQADEHVDVQRELKIANAATRYMYSKVTDVEIDSELEQLLKMSDMDADETHQHIPRNEITPVKAVTASAPGKQIDSKSFL